MAWSKRRSPPKSCFPPLNADKLNEDLTFDFSEVPIVNAFRTVLICVSRGVCARLDRQPLQHLHGGAGNTHRQDRREKTEKHGACRACGGMVHTGHPTEVREGMRAHLQLDSMDHSFYMFLQGKELGLRRPGAEDVRECGWVCVVAMSGAQRHHGAVVPASEDCIR